MTDPAGLVDAVRAGDRGALARLLSVVEAGGDEARAALAELPVSAADAAWTIGITGAPGARASRRSPPRSCGTCGRRGARVGVLAVDPTSPFTGGAILGDRVRMHDHTTDPDVFIRSMATRGHHGGLARAVPQAIRVLAAAGYDVVVVETVGVGQVEVGIAGTADTTVVVVNPGWGDGVQAAKAGLLEIGDVFVVNKADRDGVAADRPRPPGHARARGRAPGDLRCSRPSPPRTAASTRCSTRSNAIGPNLEGSGELAQRRERRIADEIRALVLDRLIKQADDFCSGTRFATVVRGVADGESDPYTAATLLTEGGDGGKA